MVEVGAAEVVVPPAKRRRLVALKNGAPTAAGWRPRPGRKRAAIRRLFRPAAPSSGAPAPCPHPPRSLCSAPCSCSMAARSSRSVEEQLERHEDRRPPPRRRLLGEGTLPGEGSRRSSSAWMMRRSAWATRRSRGAPGLVLASASWSRVVAAVT